MKFSSGFPVKAKQKGVPQKEIGTIGIKYMLALEQLSTGFDQPSAASSFKSRSISESAARFLRNKKRILHCIPQK